jgi:hypothetical protein
MRKGGLDALALALMYRDAVDNGVPFTRPNEKDRRGIDPMRMSDRALGPYIHDSRRKLEGLFDRDRQERTIYYGDGSSETVNAQELNKRWRNQPGLMERVVEGYNGENTTENQ